jgi:hypothetical protein
MTSCCCSSSSALSRPDNQQAETTQQRRLRRVPARDTDGTASGPASHAGAATTTWPGRPPGGEVFTMTFTRGGIRENHVVEFEEGRIAWMPAGAGPGPPEHLWR